MEKEEYIKKAKEIHGDKYSYDSVPEKFNGRDRIPLICNLHGKFLSIARNHIHGAHSGCPICGRERAGKSISLSFEDFVKKARLKHSDKYEYFKEYYVNVTTKTKIFCKKCQKFFEQLPISHLRRSGCSHCNPMPEKLTHEKFIKRLKETHSNLEVLSTYNGIDKPITVKCTIHNHIWTTTPHRLKQGSNCQKCYDDRRGNTLRKSIEQVLSEFRSVHGDKYQYPFIKSEYKTNKSKITIICPIHGEFIQTANKHYTRQQGCPHCSQSHMERDIMKLLPFAELQKKFDWLIHKNKLSLDFYLPEHNIAIECQGEQHFKARKLFGGQEGFEYNLLRDKIKNELCKKHNIKIIYIIPQKFIKRAKQDTFEGLYNENNVIVYEDLLSDKNTLFNIIK